MQGMQFLQQQKARFTSLLTWRGCSRRGSAPRTKGTDSHPMPRITGFLCPAACTRCTTGARGASTGILSVLRCQRAWKSCQSKRLPPAREGRARARREEAPGMGRRPRPQAERRGRPRAGGRANFRHCPPRSLTLVLAREGLKPRAPRGPSPRGLPRQRPRAKSRNRKRRRTEAAPACLWESPCKTGVVYEKKICINKKVRCPGDQAAPPRCRYQTHFFT
mmetsp:Transcript_3649/g.10376  ORF Transcript_3649/g.10376 Transcript_3649/m.10376 type:complete len:220 (+) Transcript_3649:2935-3594(+)